MCNIIIKTNKKILTLYNALNDMYFKCKFPIDIENKIIELMKEQIKIRH